MFKEWKSIVSRPLKIIDILVSAVVIGITLFLIFFWKNIPEQVPQHWNAAGEIDDYADAGGYIMLVIFSMRGIICQSFHLYLAGKKMSLEKNWLIKLRRKWNIK